MYVAFDCTIIYDLHLCMDGNDLMHACGAMFRFGA